MKKLTALLLTVLMIISLWGCAVKTDTQTDIGTNAPDTKKPEVTNDTESTPESETEKEPEIIYPTKVVKIKDTTPKDIALPDVIEIFFINGNYTYYFPNPISKYIIVTYRDGTTQNVKDALADGNVTLFELDRYNIRYFKEFKLAEENKGKEIVKIVNRAITDRLPVSQAFEHFYFDGNRWYQFTTIISEYMIVHFNDGTTKPIKEALYDGTATIADLDRFNIYYTTTHDSGLIILDEPISPA